MKLAVRPVPTGHRNAPTDTADSPVGPAPSASSPNEHAATGSTTSKAAGSLAISSLSGLEGFGRSIPTSIVPILALEALGTRTAVSHAYLIGSSLALVATLNVGRLHNLMPRRWIVSMSMLMLLIGVAIFATADGLVFAAGIALLSIGAAVFSVCISLFTIENIPKVDLTGHESRRLVFNGGAWMAGPAVASWLYADVGRFVPFALSGGALAAGLLYFWSIRLGPSSAFTPKAAAPPIVHNIPRFFRQRHLRLAYAVTAVRAIFWFGLFIYSPHYVVDASLPVWVAGVLLSTAAGLLLASPVIRRTAERHGTRHVVIGGYLIIALALGTLAWIGEPTAAGVVVWFVAAIGGAMIDVVANIPFMRTVDQAEQLEMTTVFSTWREVSAMLAPGLGALVLLVGPFRLFYLAVAGASLATALWAIALPRDV